MQRKCIVFVRILRGDFNVKCTKINNREKQIKKCWNGKGLE